MEVVELFAGIGGFRSGFTEAAIKLGKDISFPFVSEWDKFAKISYEAIWGEVPHGDITKIEAKDVPDHDVLVGGFPCQAFSTAGKMKGFDDTRGTLFFDMARIAKEKQPKAILMENTKGLVGHDKGNALDVMVKTLNDIGYVVDFDVLNSKYFDVPQNRERIFIVAIRQDLIPSQKWDIKGSNVVAKGKRRLSGYDGIKSFVFDFPDNATVTTSLRDVLEHCADEKYYLSTEKTETLLEELEKSKGVGTGMTGETASLCLGNNLSAALDANYAKGMGPSDIGSNRARRSHIVECATTSDVGVRPVLTPERLQKRQNGRRFKSEGEPMFTLTSQDRHGVLLGVDAHSFSKKLEFGGFEKVDVAGALLATDYKAPQCVLVGNVNPSGSCMGGCVYHSEGLSPTLTTGKGEGAKVLVGEQLRRNLEKVVQSIAKKTRPNEDVSIKFKEDGDIRPHRNDDRKSMRYRIRKLTPLECWRLQAFDDDMFYRAQRAGVSNSQLYKQAGNSVTTTVIEAIAINMIEMLDAIQRGEVPTQRDLHRPEQLSLF